MFIVLTPEPVQRDWLRVGHGGNHVPVVPRRHITPEPPNVPNGNSEERKPDTPDEHSDRSGCLNRRLRVQQLQNCNMRNERPLHFLQLTGLAITVPIPQVPDRASLGPGAQIAIQFCRK